MTDFDSDDIDGLDDEAMADGGLAQVEVLLETRERLSHVESSVGSIESTVDRIEGKVDDVQEEVQQVDEDSLAKERFEDRWKERIERNARITTILKWGGPALLAVGGIAVATYDAGLLPA